MNGTCATGVLAAVGFTGFTGFLAGHAAKLFGAATVVKLAGVFGFV